MVCGLLLIVAAGLITAASGQQPNPAVSKEKRSHKLVVKDGPLISLTAKGATLAEIGSDLAKQLNAKVVVSTILQQQPTKVDFTDLALEPALQLLAPQVFVDYEIGAEQQHPVGIFLLAYNEPAPSLSAAVASTSQALLITGDTEDGVEPTTEEGRKRQEENPLRVAFLNNKLTVRVRQQPLIAVVLRVGEELGIPVEIKDDSREVISMEIVAMPVEEAVQRISANVRLYVRADLQRLDRRPFRLILNQPPQKSVSNLRGFGPITTFSLRWNLPVHNIRSQIC
jgi:hypothetical protein